MKNLSVAVVIILAALLIAPKFIASLVDGERQKVLAELNEIDGLTLIDSEYTQGWFGADARSKLTLSLASAGLADITLLLEEELSFGPVLITDEGWHLGLGYSAIKFEFSAIEVDEKVIDIINDKLHLGALLSFNNEVTTFIKIKEMRYEEGGTSLISAPVLAKLSFINNEHIIGDFTWGGLEFTELGERFVIGNVAMTTEQEVVSGYYLQGTGILTGNATFNIEKVDMYSQNKHTFSLNNAEVTSVVSLDHDLLAFTLNYHAKEISASGKRFEDPNLALVLKNIDINALQELNTTIASLPVNASEQDNSAEIIQALLNVAGKLLAKDPRLKISDLSVVTDDGKISSELNVKFNKDLFDLNNVNVMTMIMALEANAQGKIPMAFLSKLGMEPMVDNFVEQGYLNKQENEISFEADYVQSQLTVNGKLFQL